MKYKLLVYDPALHTMRINDHRAFIGWDITRMVQLNEREWKVFLRRKPDHVHWIPQSLRPVREFISEDRFIPFTIITFKPFMRWTPGEVKKK